MICYLGLGSNLGDREALLRAALKRLAVVPGLRLVRSSSLYETAPWGGVEQGPFLNLVTETETHLEPTDLLRETQAIEAALGRVRGERWGPRVVDIDLLLCGDVQLSTPELTVPHPLLEARQFVLVPLAELAPDLPLPSGRTARALAEPGSPEIALWGPPPWKCRPP